MDPANELTPTLCNIRKGRSSYLARQALLDAIQRGEFKIKFEKPGKATICLSNSSSEKKIHLLFDDKALASKFQRACTTKPKAEKIADEDTNPDTLDEELRDIGNEKDESDGHSTSS